MGTPHKTRPTEPQACDARAALLSLQLELAEAYCALGAAAADARVGTALPAYAAVHRSPPDTPEGAPRVAEALGAFGRALCDAGVRDPAIAPQLDRCIALRGQILELEQPPCPVPAAVAAAPPARGRGAWGLVAALAALALLAGGVAALVRSGSKGAPGLAEPEPLLVATAERDLGPTGGAVSLPSGAALVFPPDALSSPTRITVRELKPASPLPHGQQRVILDCGPDGARFARPVQFRIPAPPGHEAGGYTAAGYTDARTGVQHLLPSRVEPGAGGRAELVFETDHFSRFFGLFGGTLPTERRLEIPYYSQGDSPYCWAAALYMALQAIRPDPQGGLGIHGIIGHMKVGENGITAQQFAGASAFGGFSWWQSALYPLVLNRTGCRVATRSYGTLSAKRTMFDAIKNDIGANGHPVLVWSGRKQHVWLVVGYDGNQVIVHDPALDEPYVMGHNSWLTSSGHSSHKRPEAKPFDDSLGTALGMGDTTPAKTKSRISAETDETSIGDLWYTMTFQAEKLDPAAPKITLSIPSHGTTLRFVAPATKAAPERTYRFHWSPEAADGFVFRRTEGGKDAGTVTTLPGDVASLVPVVALTNMGYDKAIRASVAYRIYSDQNRKHGYSTSFSADLPAKGGKTVTASGSEIAVSAFRDPANDRAACTYVFDAHVLYRADQADRVQFRFTLGPRSVAPPKDTPKAPAPTIAIEPVPPKAVGDAVYLRAIVGNLPLDAEYEWDFGDGEQVRTRDRIVTHIYKTVPARPARVRLYDSKTKQLLAQAEYPVPVSVPATTTGRATTRWDNGNVHEVFDYIKPHLASPKDLEQYKLTRLPDSAGGGMVAIHGNYKSYSRNGKLYVECEYRNGKPVPGTYREYDPTGKVIKQQ
ncbi:MAG TPA: C39 family peptidase [Planctomycetota bacterium]|nr:C39 family peptidase [Planctomycetota bacterium]HRR78733.1 C39 family peptidase [Planctomycetota bacterium]HRT95683.1 C39 family peptidase [Planctomycetota bacterium]